MSEYTESEEQEVLSYFPELLPSVNSYITGVEFYDFCFYKRLNAPRDIGGNWQKAVLLASKIIDQLDFIGTVTDVNQPLQWPRINAVNRNGQPIASNVIPGGIKDATCELAYFLLTHDITDPLRARYIFDLTSERIGESQTSFKAHGGKLPEFVLTLLKPYLVEQSRYSCRLIP